jgi:hypothetical protein
MEQEVTYTTKDIETWLIDFFGVDDRSPWNALEYGSDPIDSPYGVIEVVEEEGGEGQGDYACAVISVTDKDYAPRYFRKEGDYTSYDGFEWDGAFREVWPQQVTRTEYISRKP